MSTSVTSCPQCRIEAKLPQGQEPIRETWGPWGHQDTKYQEMTGAEMCPSGSHHSPGSVWGTLVPTTYRLSFLPLRARKPCWPPWALGRKEENERWGEGRKQGWGGMGPYLQDLPGVQGCLGRPGKQQLRK